MSHTLDRLAFFTRKTELFSDRHGVMNDDDRSWEEAYRNRWRQHRELKNKELRQNQLKERQPRPCRPTSAR